MSANTGPIKSAVFCDRKQLMEARRSDPPNPERLHEIEDVPFCACSPSRRNWASTSSPTVSFAAVEFHGRFHRRGRGFRLRRRRGAQLGYGAAGRVRRLASGRVAGVVVEKLRAVRPLTGHELPFLKQHSPGAIKMTLPSATQFPAISYKRGRSDKAYPTYSAMLWDIVEIMKNGNGSTGVGGREIHSNRRAALQLLHGSEVARMDSHGDEG